MRIESDESSEEDGTICHQTFLNEEDVQLAKDFADNFESDNDDYEDVVESDDEEIDFTIGEATSRFTRDSISHDIDYLRCVRRVLTENLQIQGKAKVQDYQHFLLKREKTMQAARTAYIKKHFGECSIDTKSKVLDDLKTNNAEVYVEPDILFDAWMIVNYTPRTIFPTNAFFKRYPSLNKKVAQLRESMNIGRKTKTKSEEIKYAVENTLREVIDEVCLI